MTDEECKPKPAPDWWREDPDRSWREFVALQDEYSRVCRICSNVEFQRNWVRGCKLGGKVVKGLNWIPGWPGIPHPEHPENADQEIADWNAWVMWLRELAQKAEPADRDSSEPLSEGTVKGGVKDAPKKPRPDSEPAGQSDAKCPVCGGEGVVDSGGSTPWGEWIMRDCPACRGERARKKRGE